MEFGSSEKFGTWIAKRATAVLVVFLVWSWFVSSPDTFTRAAERTGAAWCAAFPCANDRNVDGDGDAGAGAGGGGWCGVGVA